MNRKRKPKSAGRTVTLKACSTVDERTVIEGKARAAGISVSRLLIDSALGDRIPRRSRTADAVVRKNQILLGLARHLDEAVMILLREGALDAFALAAHTEATAQVLRAASEVERAADKDPDTASQT